MTKAKAVQQPVAPKTQKRRRVPLWRRINRHHFFFLHVVLFIIGSIVIWSLPASQPDQQFDSLTWLVLVCAHGMLAYRKRRVAFVFHLLMYSAGNAAIWNLFADTPTKIALTAAWTVVIAVIGIWLYRTSLRRHGPPAPAPRRAAPVRQPEPEPVYDEYEEPEAAYEPEYEEPITYEPIDEAEAYPDEGDSYVEYSDEPPLDPDDTPVPKPKRKQKRG